MNFKAIMIVRKSDISIIEELKEELAGEEIVLAIKSDEDFDSMFGKKETVEIDIPEEELLLLALEAHKQDITLNSLIENVLRKKIEEETDL